MTQALIFDMDDLLVASAPIWRAAEEKLLGALEQTWTSEFAVRYKGMNSLDVARVIHETYRPQWPLAQSQQMMRDALIQGFMDNLHPMPGAVELVQRVAGRVPMAVASGSPPSAIERVLEMLQIRPFFSVVISSEKVTRGKPHPDVFLATAAELGVAPANCLVFEDSLVGVRAAIAAGMRCFSVPSHDPEEIARVATRTFESLAQIKVADIFPAPHHCPDN